LERREKGARRKDGDKTKRGAVRNQKGGQHSVAPSARPGRTYQAVEGEQSRSADEKVVNVEWTVDEVEKALV
jgi:hypothetical protein